MLHLVNRLTLFSLIGLLVVAPSREDFGYASDPFRQTTQERRGAGSGAGGENDVRALEPGKPHRRVLADGQRHTYRIRLAADQFLKAVIEQDGIDVVARLLGPDGKQIMEFDSERRLRGRETVAQVAEGEGDYRLVVQPRQKAAQAGAYEIQIEELRAATDADRALQEARKLYKKAIDLRNAGKYDEALSPFERALEIRERRLGPDHPDVSQAINSLATLHYYKGEYTKAEPLYQRALAIREKSLGPGHPDVASSLNNLASLYWSLGDYAKAEPLYQRAKATMRRRSRSFNARWPSGRKRSGRNTPRSLTLSAVSPSSIITKATTRRRSRSINARWPSGRKLWGRNTPMSVFHSTISPFFMRQKAPSLRPSPFSHAPMPSANATSRSISPPAPNARNSLTSPSSRERPTSPSRFLVKPSRMILRRLTWLSRLCSDGKGADSM